MNYYEKEEMKFQATLIAIMLTTIFLIGGCATWFKNRDTLDVLNITVAAANFEKVTEAVKRIDFTEDDLNKLAKVEQDFRDVVEIVTGAGNIITIDQIKILRTSIKDVYLMGHDIIVTRLHTASVADKMLILDFHTRMIEIDIMIQEFEDGKDLEGNQEAMNNILAVLSIAAQVLPALI